MKASLGPKCNLEIAEDQEGTIWTSFKRLFCPCLVSKTLRSIDTSYLKNELIESSSVRSKLDSEMTHK
jgi:hypothetical protein